MGYTTLEESKLLVELGVNPETADMHYWNAEGKDYVYVGKSDTVNSEPCWSLDALINLFPIAINQPQFTLTRTCYDINTKKQGINWYAEWEDDRLYLRLTDENSPVSAVVKLIEKLVKAMSIDYLNNK